MLLEGRPWFLGHVARVGLAAMLALVLLAAAAMATRHPSWASLPLVIAASILVALVLSSLSLCRGAELGEALSSSSVSDWEFCVTGDASLGATGYRCRAVAQRREMPTGEVWLVSEDRFALGSRIRCVGRYSANGDDEWGTSSRAQGLWGQVRVVRTLDVCAPQGPARLVATLREALVASFEPSKSASRALLAGCICGWRDELRAQGLDELFSTCGLSHLVAVSGSHLSLFCALLGHTLERLRLRPRQRFAVLQLCAGAFVLLCGAPASAIRAWAMLACAQGAQALGRRSHALSGASAAGLVMALLDPSLAGQLGFLLSITSVCALCLFAPYATYALEVVVPPPMLPRSLSAPARRRIHGMRDHLCSSLGATLVAQLATLALGAQAFGSVSLVAPLATVLVSGPFELFVTAGLLCGALLPLPLVQHAALVLCDAIACLVLLMLETCARIPFASISLHAEGPLLHLAMAMVAVMLLLAWPTLTRPKVAGLAYVTLAVATLLVVRWRYFAPARITVLDVGQGDAILVQDGSAAVLVDAGPADAVTQALARNHVLHLDAVVITHLHADHYAGVEALVGAIPCDRALVACGVTENMPADLSDAVHTLTGKEAMEIGYGDELVVGSYTLRVVWPHEAVAGTENADSLELVATYDRDGNTLVALLTGDAERDETQQVMAAGDVGDIDLLKVGHHGSEVSLTAEEAQALRPEVSVASAGENNSYGHPRKECVEALEAAGSRFLCTKDAGDVEVRPGPDGPQVRCQSAPTA